MVACDPSGRLTSEQVARFRKDGFLVLEGFATPDEVRAMLTRADELVDGFDPATHPRSVFSTVDQKRTSDAYFLDSGNHVSFFFEERAFDRDGKLAQDKRLSINKMGHAMHDLDPTFRAFSRSEKMAALLASLEVNKPVPVQSMYIFKIQSSAERWSPTRTPRSSTPDPPRAWGCGSPSRTARKPTDVCGPSRSRTRRACDDA